MNLAFEKFSPLEQVTINDDFKRLEAMVLKTSGSSLPLAKWFGAADRVRLSNNLAKMRAVIADKGRTITFVNRRGGVLKVEYKSLLQPELLPKGHPGNKLVETAPSGQKYGAIAYAFPVNRLDDVPNAKTLDDLDGLATSSHVGSGMRLYLTELYFKQGERARSATIYHELTHKVLACEDHCYEAGPCQKLASTPDLAIRNADNYAMFLLDC
jgi:hypothetical protein